MNIIKEYGVNYASDLQILSTLIGDKYATKLKDITLRQLAKKTVSELQHFGLTENKATTLLAAINIGTRIEEAAQKEVVDCVRSSADLYAHIQHIQHLQIESLWVIGLNKGNGIVFKKQVSIGGIAGTVVDVRVIFRELFVNNCSAYALAHNHPSGNLQPSDADITITRKMNEASKNMDLVLIDHIIVGGEGGYYSFADNGLT